MWSGKRMPMNRLNDYWNALDRHAPLEELAQLRAQIDPELTATIDSAIALHRRRRPDLVFSNRLEGELMNAFAVSASGALVLPHIQAPSSNGRGAPVPPARWIPTTGEMDTRRRSLAVSLGLVGLLLLTLIGGVFVFSVRSDHPAVFQQGTPVSTPTQDWTNTRGDAGRTGLGESGPVGHPVTIWKFQADGPCDTAPAAVGDTVFAACGNGTLYAIDRATGVETWEFDAQSPIGGGPTVVDGIVSLIDVDGRLYGVDAETGQQIWLVDGAFGGAPVGQDGLLVAGGTDGYLTALDLVTGQERWRTLIEDGGESKNPAMGDGLVYTGSIASGFTAVDAATGEIVWHAETDGIETGTAVVANGVAYIGSAPGVAEGFLMAFDAKTGDQLWRSDEPIFTPAVQDGIGYAGSGGGEVTALDLSTGEVLWQEMVGGVARPATVAGDVVYMNSDSDEAIYAFDTKTGDQLWKFPVNGYLGDAPALKDGVLYAATGGGTIYALGGENAIPAAVPATPSPESAASAIPASPMADSPAAIEAELLWSTPGGDGGLSQTGYVTIAPDGNLWVADNGNHRFQIASPDGAFIEAWGEKGTGDGQFQLISATGDGYGEVAFAPDGTFFVLDPGNYRVQHFDANRQFIASFGTFGTAPGQFAGPTSLFVDDAGTVWVLDGVQNSIQQLSANGVPLKKLQIGGVNGAGWNGTSMAMAPDGTIFVTDCGPNCDTFSVLHYDQNGELLGVIKAGASDPWANHQPVDIAFDAAGNIYVTTMIWNRSVGYVVVFDPSGKLVTSWDIGGNPYGIALDDDGNVYIAQWVEDTLSKYALPASFGLATPVA